MPSPSADPETQSVQKPDTTEKKGLGLSTPQVLGSALAAASAAVFSSWLGVAGTIVGAALGSVVATIGGAVYTHSIRRTSTAVRRNVLPARDGRSVTVDPVVPWSAMPWRHLTWTALPWKGIALGSAVALAVALGSLTLVEKLAGEPLSAVTRGGGGEGTTVGQVFGGKSDKTEKPTRNGKSDPTPTSEPTETPSDQPVTPSDSPTPTPTETPTPEVTDTVSPEPSVPPTPTPSDAAPTAQTTP